MKFKSSWTEYVLFLAIVIFGAVMSYYSILRHNTFSSSFDLANMDQTVWNTSQGRFFSLSGNTGTVSRIGLHADLLLALLAPLFWLWPKVEVLLILQSFIVGFGALAVYLIGKSVLGNRMKAVTVSFAYLINAGVMWSVMYDFHPVTLAATFLLFAFYFALEKRDNWLFLFLILSLLTKESVGMFVFMIGLFIYFLQKRRIGLLVSILGALWTVSMIYWLMPKFSVVGEHWAWGWFRFKNSKQLFDRVFSPESEVYLKILFKQFGFLPLAGLPLILLSAPDLALNMLSAQGQMRSIFFHYDALVVVGLVLAAIYGWKILDKLFIKNMHLQWIPGIVMLAFALRTNYHYSPLPYTPSHWRPMYEITETDKEFDSILKKIPIEASITSSSEIRPHVTHRENSFNLPNMVGKTDYVAIIDQNRIVGDHGPKKFEMELIERLIADEEYTLEYQKGHFYLFKRN